MKYLRRGGFYSHVNYSVTKIFDSHDEVREDFYSHVNYSVTKMRRQTGNA